MWEKYKNHWQEDDWKHKTWWLSGWPEKSGFCTGLMRGEGFRQTCPLRVLMSCCHQASLLGIAAPPVEKQLQMPEGLFSSSPCSSISNHVRMVYQHIGRTSRVTSNFPNFLQVKQINWVLMMCYTGCGGPSCDSAPSSSTCNHPRLF